MTFRLKPKKVSQHVLDCGLTYTAGYCDHFSLRSSSGGFRQSNQGSVSIVNDKAVTFFVRKITAYNSGTSAIIKRLINEVMTIVILSFYRKEQPRITYKPAVY